MALYYMKDLQALREEAGLRKSELAHKSGVDRGTIAKLENHNGARKETCIKIFNALFEVFKEKFRRRLDRDRIITQKPENNTKNDGEDA